MSILVIEVLHEGIVFGADKNITTQYADGRTRQEQQVSKVTRWPNERCLFGFVGAAQMGQVPMMEWLTTLQNDFVQMQSLEEIAQELYKRVQEQRDEDDKNKQPEPLIIHLGGFERRDGFWVPVVWHIGNVYKLGRYGYLDVRRQFYKNEAFWTNNQIKEVDPSEIRSFLKVQAKQFQPFWFHQGLDLFTFNVLQDAIKSAFKLLCERHPNHDMCPLQKGLVLASGCPSWYTAARRCSRG